MKKIIVFLTAITVSISVFSAEICVPKRDKSGKIKRSSYVVKKFKRANACPATGIVQNACPGYVVDHIKPLCKCGADSVENMQWQTLAASKIKDKAECLDQ
jgi:hypothetical protein